MPARTCGQVTQDRLVWPQCIDMSTGVWPLSELTTKLSEYQVRRLVAAGHLVKVGRGWYASPLAPEKLVAAVRAGGRLGCLSGCELHGLWVPPQGGVHVTFQRQLPALPSPGVVGHRDRGTSQKTALRPLLDCLTDVVRHHDAETALIVLDSAINRGCITEADAVNLVMECPKYTHPVLRYLDGRADSGTETRVRYFFQRRRVPVQPQAYIPGVGRVDLLVGRSLMIECDSRAHHTGEENYARDRGRDLLLIGDGNHVLRLSYEQVFYQWPRTQSILVRILAARVHRRPPLSAK